MTKKILAVLLAAAMVLSLGAAAFAEISDEEGAAWAEANGYVKMEDDLGTSATEAKQGGVNYGAIEWSRELQEAAIKEWLKGGTYLGSEDYAQDETGFNYREMFQMATSYNNIPSNTNLELVLDVDSMNLLGVSEAGTGKTLQFMRNPNVSISWCKQLRLLEEEDTYNYYCSYGITFNGTVKLYTAEDLETEEGQDALLNLFDKYYPTLASTWQAYAGAMAAAEDEAGVREAKLAYISKLINGGSMVIYEVVPSKIVITAPFMLNMVPSYSNATKFTTVQEGEDKYAYDLDITDEFLDMVIAYKNEYLADEANKAAVEEYYSSAMFQMLDQYAAAYGMPTSLEYALADNSAAGIKTQTTWMPEA